MINRLVDKRVQAVFAVLFIALIALAGLLLLFEVLAAPDPPTPLVLYNDAEMSSTQSGNTSSIPAPNPKLNIEAVATVNDETITKQAWQQATLLDVVMSELVAQPIPTTEETLERLINEMIVLQGVEDVAVPTTSEIESRLLALHTAWNVNDEAIEAALTQIGLDRSDLTERVGRLLQVEAALQQLAQQEGDVDAWLMRARAEAEIGLYQSLANTRPSQTQAVLPTATVPPEAVAQVTEADIDVAPVVFAPPADMPFGPYPQNAAPDFTLPQLDDQPLTLSDFRGKPVMINFWATWCPPCRRELPALQAAYNNYSDKIEFVAVDVKENAPTVTAFIDQMGLTFPIVMDQSGSVSDVAYEVRGLPTTIFVDAKGVVSARHVGPLDEAAIDSYLLPLLAPNLDNSTPALVEPDSALQEGIATSTTVAQDASSALSGSEGDQTAEMVPAGADLPLAPEFTLSAGNGDQVSLQDYRGQSDVVLVFYRGHT